MVKQSEHPRAPLIPVAVAFLLGTLCPMTAMGVLACLVAGSVGALMALGRRRSLRSGLVALLMLWACLGALRAAA